MEKTLDIIITHYNESEEVYKPLFDSIALQQCIDFGRIGVIVENDGHEHPIPQEFFGQYKYDIRYIENDHAGISRTRNAGIKDSEAEYIMWCDCDDMFCSVFGLLYILNEIDKGEFDAFNPDFIEETRDGNGKIKFATHHDDHTFVHGKVFRREWLIRNNLKFNPNINIHEDALFNAVVLNVAGDKSIRVTKNPFYLWKWRKESVCRSEPDFVLKTYDILIKSRRQLVEDLIARGNAYQANFYSAMMILDGFYLSNTPAWKKPENAEYRQRAFKLLSAYWNNYKDAINKVPKDAMSVIAMKARERAVNEGLVTEDYTFTEFIRTIEAL